MAPMNQVSVIVKQEPELMNQDPEIMNSIAQSNGIMTCDLKFQAMPNRVSVIALNPNVSSNASTPNFPSSTLPTSSPALSIQGVKRKHPYGFIQYNSHRLSSSPTLPASFPNLQASYPTLPGSFPAIPPSPKLPLSPTFSTTFQELPTPATSFIGYYSHRHNIHNIHKFIRVRNFQCTKCPQTRATAQLLNLHLRHDHKCPPFVCRAKDCLFQQLNGGFFRKIDLEAHISKDHTDNPNWQCEKCGFEIKTRQLMDEHIWLHELGKFECTKCDWTCARRIQLLDHIKLDHNAGDVEVSIKKQRVMPKSIERSIERVANPKFQMSSLESFRKVCPINVPESIPKETVDHGSGSEVQMEPMDLSAKPNSLKLKQIQKLLKVKASKTSKTFKTQKSKKLKKLTPQKFKENPIEEAQDLIEQAAIQLLAAFWKAKHLANESSSEEDGESMIPTDTEHAQLNKDQKLTTTIELSTYDLDHDHDYELANAQLNNPNLTTTIDQLSTLDHNYVESSSNKSLESLRQVCPIKVPETISEKASSSLDNQLNRKLDRHLNDSTQKVKRGSRSKVREPSAERPPNPPPRPPLPPTPPPSPRNSRTRGFHRCEVIDETKIKLFRKARTQKPNNDLENQENPGQDAHDLDKPQETNNDSDTENWDPYAHPILRRLPKPSEIEIPKLRTRKMEKVLNKKYHDRSVLIEESLLAMSKKVGKYQIGDLVLAKCEGWPYWPAMIVIDPESKAFVQGYKTKHYFVQYFGNEMFVDWTSVHSLRPYTGWPALRKQLSQELPKLSKESANNLIDKFTVQKKFQQVWSESIGEADEARLLSRERRLRLLTYEYVDKI